MAGATYYKLQVSENSDFSTLIVEQSSVVDTFFQCPTLNYITQYYWRVQAYNQTSSSFWSFSRKFTTVQEYLDAPTLVFPQSDAEDLDTQINFIWNKVSNATQYVFQISRNSSFTNLRINETVNDTTFNANNLSYNTTFYWRVRAKKGNSNSNWSEARSFSVKEQDLPAPI